MAITGYYKNEQISTNDTSLYDGILSQLEQLKAAAPDKFTGDMNLADYALLFTAMAEKAGGTKVKLSIDATRSIVIDGTTNTIESSGDKVYALMRGLAGATVGFVAGSVVGAATDSPIAGFFFGNTYADWFTSNVWDEYFGPSIGLVKVTNDNPLATLLVKSDGFLEQTLNDNLHGTRDFVLKYLNSSQTETIAFGFSDSSFLYSLKDGITFQKNMDEPKTREVLKILPEGFLPKINDKKLLINMLHDYYNGNGISKSELLSMIQSGNKAAQYVVFETMLPYILSGDEGYEGFKVIPNINVYSSEHLNDRLDMYYALVRLDESGKYYYDQKTGIGIGQTNADSPGSYSRTVFVDTKYEYAPVSGKSYGQLTFYGNEKNNTITAKSRADNYVEGGLGSDTITTGMGNDTIYTNANIDSKYDHEDESTTNTVYTGAGDDKVYGSNGRDVVYGEEDDDIIIGGVGSDSLYGGKGDDILYAGRKNQNIDTDDGTRIDDGTTNYLSGGEGDDTLWGGSGDDTLDGGADEDLLWGGDNFDTY